MGDPRKIKKKYSKPKIPWEKKRILAEAALRREFGFRTKKELWKLDTYLKTVQRFFKSNITNTAPQIMKEKEDLIRKMINYGFIKEGEGFDEILSLTVEDVLRRRLQTLLFKKGLARSVKQARQFIVHKHVLVNGKLITSPNYLVKLSEEDTITFKDESSLSSENHPERKVVLKEEVTEEKVVEEKVEVTD